MKKKTLLTSLLIIVMCLSLSIGATFALFTSSSEVDISVTSATVDVKATTSKLDTNIYSGSASLNGNQITVERMIPGDSFSFDIDIVNYSNVTVQYRTIISSIDGGLFTALRVTLTENGEKTVYSGGYVYQNWTELLANDNDETTPEAVKTINVLVEFPETGEPQNQYQNKSCTINVLVEAVQGNAEVENPIDYDAENDLYIVNNEQGMMLLNGIINSTPHGEGRPINIALNDDMDMSAYEWMALELHWVNFDGQGHKISNLNCVPNPTVSASRGGQVGFACYFGGSTITGVTFENVTVKGDQAGIVAGHYEGGTVSNVVIDGLNLVEWQDAEVEKYGGIGAVFGVMSQDLPARYEVGPAVTFVDGSKTIVNYNDMITQLEVTGNELCFNNRSINATVPDASVEIIGKLSESVDGTIILADGTYLIYNVDNLFDFANAVNSNTANENNFINGAKLCADIDLSGIDWTPIGNGVHRFAGAFDGQGYKVYGLSYDKVDDCIAFFGGIVNATIKNVNFDGFDVQPAGGRYVSAVTAYAFGNNTFENVHVSNSYISGVAMVGGFIGSVNELYVDNTFIDCSITDSRIVVAFDGGSFIGYSNFGCGVEFNGCSATNVEFQLSGGVGGGTYYEYVGGTMYWVENGNYYASAGKLYSYASINGGAVMDAQDGVILQNVGYVGGYLWDSIDFNTCYVQTAEGLTYVSNLVSGGYDFYGDNVVLIDDIDLSGIDWAPIGNGYNNFFHATVFDGLGYTIYGLTQTQAWDSYGLFGNLWDVTVKNLNIENANVTTQNGMAVGVVAGYAFGKVTLENVTVKDFYVSGMLFVGSLIGHSPSDANYDIKFINCTVDDGMVVAGYDAGGILGYLGNDTAISFSNCVLNDVALQLTFADDQYAFDSEGRLYWGPYTAMGVIYSGEIYYAGTPINQVDGVTVTDVYYDIVAWYPNGRVDV